MNCSAFMTCMMLPFTLWTTWPLTLILARALHSNSARLPPPRPFRATPTALLPVFTNPNSPSSTAVTISPCGAPTLLHLMPDVSHPVNLAIMLPTVFSPVYSPLFDSPVHLTFVLLAVSSVARLPGFIFASNPGKGSFVRPGYHSYSFGPPGVVQFAVLNLAVPAGSFLHTPKSGAAAEALPTATALIAAAVTTQSPMILMWGRSTRR